MSSIRIRPPGMRQCSLLLSILLMCRIVTTTGRTLFSCGNTRHHAFQPRRTTTTEILHPMTILLLQGEDKLLRGGVSSSSKSINMNEEYEEEDEEANDDEEVAVGATAPSVDEEEDEEEVEELENKKSISAEAAAATKIDTKLATAALKSVTKTKEKIVQQNTAILKQAVQSKLSTTPQTTTKKTKTNRSSSVLQVYKRVVPYIVRAAMNPFTFIAMTKSYWASLFNLNYLHEQQSMNNESGNTMLRTAMEEQEKRKVSLPSSNRQSKKKTMKRGHAKTLNDLPKLSS